jgi:hypothetical protein
MNSMTIEDNSNEHLSEAVISLKSSARALYVDVPLETRLVARFLKQQARNLLKSDISDADIDAISDLMITLDLFHRGRIAL